MSQMRSLQNPEQLAVSGTAIAEVAACCICGAQDETIRVVSYPYTLSLVVVTYRRAYTGIWCARHRRRFRLYASAITATLGWLGIPFGLIWTPLTLLKLACGGIQPPAANVGMLRGFAKQFLNAGEYLRAVKCLEESLKFEDDPTTRAKIGSLRSLHFLKDSEPGCFGRIGSVVGLMVLAGLIGTGAAGVDSIVALVWSTLFASVPYLFFAILSWAPMIALAFIAGLILFSLLESTIARLHITSRPPAILLALAASLLGVYGMLEGFMLSSYLGALATPGVFSSVADAIAAGVAVLVMGGVIFISTVLPPSNPSDVIFSLIIASIFVYFLAFSWRASGQATAWQHRLRG
jgi:hypothetical protein